ncbi:transcription termination factor 5, mitochondrial [Uranotaenia lowii]|uniref:transcription termination factor 5, mitochondrial n=1 Tax=Uranotaenia lowii TaxID=190385 RepID=UPI002478B7EE|nr:transcription termination factor 5, mitochondrial [Uranotaenia lowii]
MNTARFRLLINRSKYFPRLYTTDAGFGNLHEATKFYSPLFNMNDSTMYKYLAKHSFLMDLSPTDIKRKVSYLKYINADNSEILAYPKLLTLHLITIENRTTILRECGLVETLNLLTISKYITIIKKTIDTLKKNKLIPADLDMVEQLKKQFDTGVFPDIKSSADLELQSLRELFMDTFLRQRLSLNDQESAKLWKSYSKIKHKSFGHTQRVLDILQHDYKFSRDKIVANFFLLYADPENLLRFPNTVPKIADVSIRELVLKQPKILMVPCDNVKEIQTLLQEHGIAEAGVLKFSSILTLAPASILARIQQLRKTKEFEVLSNHPRIVKLIAFQKKAIVRLDFLHQLKVRCASLNVLSSHSQCFEKYVRDGYDRTKGKDVAHYLNEIFDRNDDDALQRLKRHQNWYHVPIVQMQESLEYLKSKSFKIDHIYENMYLLLYPVTRISEKLEKLIACKYQQEPYEDLGIELSNVTPEQMLSLCLYLVELDFHFTGDGVWPDQIQQSDATTTTNIDMPQTLKKEYKYGKKAPKSTISD